MNLGHILTSDTEIKIRVDESPNCEAGNHQNSRDFVTSGTTVSCYSSLEGRKTKPKINYMDSIKERAVVQLWKHST